MQRCYHSSYKMDNMDNNINTTSDTKIFSLSYWLANLLSVRPALQGGISSLLGLCTVHRVKLGDFSDAFGPSLTEENRSTEVQELWVALEAESHTPLLTHLQALLCNKQWLYNIRSSSKAETAYTLSSVQ